MNQVAGGRKFPVRTTQSAGGVVFRIFRGRPRVILVAVKGGKVWRLPKGEVEPGEDLRTTAEREVGEETGTRVLPLGKIGSIDYWFFAKEKERRVRIHKVVHFFLFRYKGGSVRRHDWEVDEARWFELDEAVRAISYANERKILEKAREKISAMLKKNN